MRFSISVGPTVRADLGETAAECWTNHVDDALLAEELGFDGYYVAEHHFGHSAGHSTPIMLLADIAARTSRIRIGTSIICAPLHNPLRLAEDLAALDIMSRGRLEIGVGVGSQIEEFKAFGIDPVERFGRTWEIIDFIEKCYASPPDEEFHWNGKYYNIPGIRWVMQPVQSPVPIAWGGFGPKGVARAAKRGYHLIAPDVTGEYRRITEADGRDPRDYLVGISDIVSIGDSQDDALDQIAEACAWVSNQYGQRTNLDGSVPPRHVFTPDDIREATRGANATFGIAAAAGEKPRPFSVPLAGTVSQIRDHYLCVVRGERGLITHIRLNIRQAGAPTAGVRRTMRLFATEILPALREEAVRLWGMRSMVQ
ncbi:LLM class flavin-dependent oxidoreductase [Sphingobium sp. MK2]|uniref:LLM class flavin-dependent oxidoreductase n=1 Tax=Sphingobium sp. MK2 TaxID=3116540 RepID=UPI0032E366EB